MKILERFFALLHILLWRVSNTLRETVEQHEETSATEIVVATKSVRLGLDPSSVLLLNPGSVLTAGSFTTEALLHSSRRLDIRVEL